MELHLSARFIAESFALNTVTPSVSRCLLLHQLAEGIPGVGGHRAARVNGQRQVSEHVILIKTLRVEIVTGGRFNPAAIGYWPPSASGFPCCACPRRRNRKTRNLRDCNAGRPSN